MDAVLLDIDHSPRHLLHPDHAVLYDCSGLTAVAARLRPGGVFGLWSDDLPDDPFSGRDARGARGGEAHTNPYTGGTFANTVYVGQLDVG